jgi:hypothetical protein
VVDGVTLNANGGALLTILAGALNCRFAPSISIGSGITITDNSGSGTSGNEIWLPSVVYTPTWAGTGGAPVIGNGAMGGRSTRRGTNCSVNLLLTVGSTTNFNTATQWTFSMPYTASRNATGTARILDSGTQYYIGVCFVAAGSNLLSIYRDAGVPIGYNTPMTWATGDTFNADIEYEIQ